MMVFKIVGALLVIWGFLGLSLSSNWAGTNVWFEIDLFSINQCLWQVIAWAEILVGAVIWRLGKIGDRDITMPRRES